ncbi:MAG: hypothetical protein KJ737_23000 [Proteobacteria bacterium]|nr:hypothetical protein [Pseudomonadota bacterium]
MAHEVNVCLTFGEDSNKYPVSGSFEDQEWESLLNFIDYTKSLQNIQLIKQGGPGKFNLTYNEIDGMTYTVELPPEDQILALLHRLRPFILKDESTNFYRVCKHLSRRFENQSFRDFIKTIRDRYSGKRMQNFLLISSNDAVINSEETLIMWLNAHEYHKDRNKQAELDHLHQVLPLEASRAFFVMMLYEKVRAISIVANLINVMDGQQETFKCCCV